LQDLLGSFAENIELFCGAFFFFFAGYAGLFLQDIYGSFASYSLFKKSPVSPATRALNLLEKMPICPVSHIKMSMAMATSFFAIQKEPYISRKSTSLVNYISGNRASTPNPRLNTKPKR